MHDAAQYLAAHWAVILVTVGAIVSPAVATMPVKIPASLNDWWTWFYDYAHQFTNSRNTRLATEPIAQPPGPAGSPK
jgi:hypothetical protein